MKQEVTMAGAQVHAEMAEQPAVLAAIAERRTEWQDLVRASVPQRLRGILLIARGSSDNVAVHARYLLELATGLPVSMVAPSLVTRYDSTPQVRDCLVVALSQSGRTPRSSTSQGVWRRPVEWWCPSPTTPTPRSPGCRRSV